MYQRRYRGDTISTVHSERKKKEILDLNVIACCALSESVDMDESMHLYHVSTFDGALISRNLATFSASRFRIN